MALLARLSAFVGPRTIGPRARGAVHRRIVIGRRRGGVMRRRYGVMRRRYARSGAAPHGITRRGFAAGGFGPDGDVESFDYLPSSTPNFFALYKLGKDLGRGKFAVVRQGEHRSTGEKVAVKIVEKSVGKRQCLAELDITRKINENVDHARVTPVKGVFEDSQRLYFVLELMSGGELFDQIVDSGRFSEERAARVLRKLIYTIQSLHHSGILHRDIKPENLMFKSSGGDGTDDSVFVSDFGAAHEIGSLPASVAGGAGAGAAGDLPAPAGTFGYAAPEVLERREYGPACDIWSAGVVAYILLSGYPPFPLGSDSAGGRSHSGSPGKDCIVQTELDAILSRRQTGWWREQFQNAPWPEISDSAKELVSRMLTVDPAKRYTAHQVLHHPWIQRSRDTHTMEYANFE